MVLQTTNSSLCHSCTSFHFSLLPWNLMLLLIISSSSSTALYSPTFTSFVSAEKQTRVIVYGSSDVLNYLTDFAFFFDSMSKGKEISLKCMNY